MEEQLECPVCFEIGGSTEINQCLNGHNICSNCRIHLDDCPICHGQFSTMRNRTVETLIKQFQEMKSSLMDPEGDKHQRINKNKKSIGCQTDPAIEVVKLSIKCQTDSFIDTKTVEADILKNELNSLIVDTKNTQSLIKPNIELTVKEKVIFV